MARVGITGFEMGSVIGEGAGGTSTGFSFDSSIVRTGATSLKVIAQSGSSIAVTFIGHSAGRCVRVYVRVTTLPASTRLLIGTIGASQLNVRLKSDGALELYNNTTLLGTSTTKLTDTSRWYRIEVRSGTITSDELLRIDGVGEVSGSITSLSTGGTVGAGDTVAATYTAYFDDMAVDDTTWPGEGKIVLLVPISDNARATLWTGGVGGTTNLFDAVNNTPPIGTATETDLTQIEHAGGAAGSTDAYDANMTSYATAGIAASDTITAIQFWIWHGEDSATGTKLLNFSLVSNPTQASSLANFTAGNDVGALGTFNVNWTRTQNGIISSPSVTVGTSPVMRVVRPETASRVASVCFMGMYVEYIPAVAASFAIPHRHRGLIVR